MYNKAHALGRRGRGRKVGMDRKLIHWIGITHLIALLLAGVTYTVKEEMHEVNTIVATEEQNDDEKNDHGYKKIKPKRQKKSVRGIPCSEATDELFPAAEFTHFPVVLPPQPLTIQDKGESVSLPIVGQNEILTEESCVKVGKRKKCTTHKIEFHAGTYMLNGTNN